MIRKNKPFSAIIIDTNAFDCKQNDFCGFFSSSIPSFFETIDRLGLKLLTHPILRGETLKHIETRDFKKRPEETGKYIIRHKEILKLIGIQVDDCIKKIEELDLCSKESNAYNHYFENAEVLSFPNPEEVFSKYFNNDPPFSVDNKKKSEFPDAFVLAALEQYISKNPKVYLLVVTADQDWISALKDNSNIKIVKDIDTALSVLNHSEKTIKECVNNLYASIADYIQHNAEMDVWFRMFEYESNEGIEIDDIRLSGIEDEIIPLKFSDDDLILQIIVKLEVDGSMTVLDENRSIWNSDEKRYIIKEFNIMSFKDAEGKVTAELYIVKDPNNKPTLEYINFIAPYGVLLEAKKDKVVHTRITFDEE